ncbi:hypothetical protein [Streptomyces coelicoflavus]|uniref:hypothetical protein n=1 Tax=Streptomyces coelicoflavus TaxID=285562 RepID=UPI003F4A0C66
MGGELAERFGKAVLDILSPEAALSASVLGVPGGGSFEYGLRLSVMYVAGGGANDIQRGMIARGLGLPRWPSRPSGPRGTRLRNPTGCGAARMTRSRSSTSVPPLLRPFRGPLLPE